MRSLGSRWKKPDLYATIVIIYLFFLIAVFFSAIGDFFYTQSLACKTDYYHCANAPASLGLGGVVIVLFVVFIGFLILVVPSIIGTIFLMQKKKKGIYFSLAPLIFWTLISTYLIWAVISPFSINGFEKYLLSGILIFSWLPLNSVMIGFLVKGWKSIQWQKKLPN